mgnify:CR=1 FL=1
MKALILRFDGLLMSFGAFIVDQHGYTDPFPGTSMLTGLTANALGWTHAEFDKLETLQRRIVYAARWDEQPEAMIDYHTVDLGQPKMSFPGWTTRGTPEHRSGGDARYGTHQRYRHYWADGLMTVALGLKDDADQPTLMDLYEAFKRPARPLFLGRKTCLPSRPLLDPESPIVEGDDILDILSKAPVWNRDGTVVAEGRKCWANWPAELEVSVRSHVREVYDLRDWRNQVVHGPSRRAEGYIGGANT